MTSAWYCTTCGVLHLSVIEPNFCPVCGQVTVEFDVPTDLADAFGG